MDEKCLKLELKGSYPCNDSNMIIQGLAEYLHWNGFCLNMSLKKAILNHEKSHQANWCVLIYNIKDREHYGQGNLQ